MKKWLMLFRRRKSANHSFRKSIIRPLTVSLCFSIIGSILIMYSMAATVDQGISVPGNLNINIPGVAVPPPPAPNPPLVFRSCTGGLNIALLADVSGSITKKTDDFNRMKSALRDFVSSLLPSTRTMFSLTQFHDDATVLRYFTNNVNDITAGIDSLGGGGGTNWTAGLRAAQSTFSGARSDSPNLLIFATDGNPTHPPLSAIAEAVTAANDIKSQNIHILVIGIGPDPQIGNLQLVSGTVMNNGVNGDVITTNFASLNGALQTVARSTCSSGTGTGGTGTGTGGTGVGTGGTGVGAGVGGSGRGSNGSGIGENGPGEGSTGSGSGTSAGRQPRPSPQPQPQPTPSPNPSAPQGVQPSPQPTPQPDQNPAPSPTAVPTPEPTPTPAPTPMAQGTRTRPPAPQPSPFYDGKEYAKGTMQDEFTAPSARRDALPLIIASTIVLLSVGAAGYVIWRRKHPASTIAPDVTKPTARTRRQD